MVRFKVNFDNSKDSCEGSDEIPVRAPKALVLILEFLFWSNVVQLIL